MYCPNPDCPDATESGVAAEYRDGITSCPVCGHALIATPPGWGFRNRQPSAISNELVPCITVGDASLLPQIKSILDAAGVPYLVKNEGVQHLIGWGTAAFGFNPITGPPVVMVDASELDRAKALLEASASAVTTPEEVPLEFASEGMHSPLLCEHCGRSLDGDAGEAALSHCYHCGWPLQTTHRALRTSLGDQHEHSGMRWGSAVRDIVMIVAMTAFSAGLIAYATGYADVPIARVMNALVSSGVVVLILGFAISGALARERRWRHVLVVAVGVWLTGLVNVLFIPRLFLTWLFSWIPVLISMALGVSLSYLFVRPTRGGTDR